MSCFEPSSYVPVKSKLRHPPRATPGHLNFWKIFVQILPSWGRKAVQMPHHRSIPGDQMPPPPGNFSVAFIMLWKLCHRYQVSRFWRETHAFRPNLTQPRHSDKISLFFFLNTTTRGKFFKINQVTNLFAFGRNKHVVFDTR